ncbi:MAG: 30S ribosomal protein S20 [Pseudomonadales bacterium]|nr:30S ribosomal protein S20 [Pseudomonadales bacterium]
MIKNAEAKITKGDYDEAMDAYRSAVPYIDRMAGRGLIHANKAARHKSRLNLKIKALQDSSS